MDIVRGALPSLIPKLADLVAGEYNLRKGVKGEIMALQAQLESFMAALEDISNTPVDQLDELTKIWSREVKELSYDLESSVDRFMLRCKADKQVRHHGFKDVIKDNVDLFIRPIIRHKFAAEIRSMKSSIHELYDRGRHRYEIEDNPNQRETIDPRLLTLFEDQERLVGIDGAKAALIKIILEGNESSMQQGNIVSIVGIGGLGKTTLANVVYQEVKGNFDCSASVSVSQTPNMDMIFKSLLRQLDKDKRETMNLDLVGKLREFLRHKRYLVVIDDIWNISAWEGIRCSLPHNDCGYRIIITTRSLNVAEQAGGCYKMSPLSLNDSRRLFYNRIFGREYKDVCPEELLKVSEKILEKCGGLPLAIIAIAGLLANKHPNKMSWHEVYNSLGGGVSTGLDITNTLSLSYTDMPSPLRTCLLYLSMFPKDYEIDKSRLIWMWIAEGFIQGSNMFKIGERYFNELIDRKRLGGYRFNMARKIIVQLRLLEASWDK